MRTRFLLHREAQMLRYTHPHRVHVCIHARCADDCFLDIYGRLFSQILGKHGSWSTFLQSREVQYVISAWPALVLLLLSISPCSFLNLNSRLQGGKDLSGEVVWSSGLRVSVYISGGYSSFPVVFPMMFQCIPVNCKRFRNFQSPQLKGSESRGHLFESVAIIGGHLRYALGMKMILGVRRINIH